MKSSTFMEITSKEIMQLRRWDLKFSWQWLWWLLSCIHCGKTVQEKAMNLACQMEDARKHWSTFSLATKITAWLQHLQNFWTHTLNQRGSLELTECLHIWEQHLTQQSSCLTTCHWLFYRSYKIAVTYSGIVCGPVSEMQCGTIHLEAGINIQPYLASGQ